MAEALYRKYRPQVFADVVGQDHIATTLQNAITQDKVSHAYLFTGPRGTGKTTMARLLAKALLCENGPTPTPCGGCKECEQIAAGEHPDVYELDAASRTGVDNVREEIIGRVNFAPTRGRYKIYIIDEVHMLSTAAFNALLKTLEEPPSHVVFVLCTTDPQKVPDTIHSRCQRFDFHRISPETIVARLGAVCVGEGVNFEGEALDVIAHHAQGGMRNALTSLEQTIAYGNGEVTLTSAQEMFGSLESSDMAEIVAAIGNFDTAACFIWVDKYVETGADLAQFTRDLATHIRNMYVMTVADADVPLNVSDSVRRELSEESKLFGPDRLARILAVLGDLSVELKTSTNPRLSFEIALTRMVHPESELTLESLAARIEALEAGAPRAKVEQAAAAVAGAASTAANMAANAATSAMDAARAKVEQAAAAASAKKEETAVAETVQANQVQQVQQSQQTQQVPVHDKSTSGTTLDLTDVALLQRTWQSTINAIKKEKASYGALFLNTRAQFEPVGKTLQIVFGPQASFAFKAVQNQQITQALAQAITQAFGGRLAFQFVLSQGSEQPQAQPTETPAQPHAATQVQTAQQQTAEQVKPAQQQAATQAQTAQPQAQMPTSSEKAVSVNAISENNEPANDEVPLSVYDDAGFNDFFSAFGDVTIEEEF